MYDRAITESNPHTPDNTRAERSGNAMDYTMIWVRGHIEVYDWAGRFCFSADNEREAREELALSA